MRFTNFTTPLLAGLACVSMGVAAQAPQVHEDAEARYVSGGIGKQERRAINALGNSMTEGFDAKIHLSAASGHYLASAEVRITDENGTTLVDTRTDGPLLLVDLPAGQYTVEARNGDRSQGATIKIGQRDGIEPVYLAWHI